MDEMVYIYHLEKLLQREYFIRQGILEKQFWVFSLREVPKEI